MMDLSAIIVAALGILFFFGGAAWPEIRSRKSNRRYSDIRRAEGEPARGQE